MRSIRLLAAAIAPLIVILGLVQALSAAQQAVVTVCPAGCDYELLQPAVNAATDGGTIIVSPGTYIQNIVVDKSLSIEGAGALGTTLDGGAAGPVLLIESGAAVTISHLAINNGLARPDKGRASGGGIYNLGRLKLFSVTVSNNSAVARTSTGGSTRNDAYGGGLFNGCTAGACAQLTLLDSFFVGNVATGSHASTKVRGGNAYGAALYNGCSDLACATAVISGTIFRDNSASGGEALPDRQVHSDAGHARGGAIANMCGDALCGRIVATASDFEGNAAWAPRSCLLATARGGALYNEGHLMIDQVTVHENSAINHKSVCRPHYESYSYGGGIYNRGSFTVTASTISWNTSGSSGGGIYNGTGAEASLSNSTVSNNDLIAGGGAGIFNSAFLTGDYVTIAYNRANIADLYSWSAGGGVYDYNGETHLSNTVLVANTSKAYNPWPVETKASDCSGMLQSGGYNLVGTTAGCTITGTMTGLLLDIPAALFSLADYGGPNMTHAVPKGSPLLDAADPGHCLATDQRGQPRPAPGNDRCDIGAFEGYFQPPNLVYLASVSK